MSKIKGDINCTHPVLLASAPVDETDVVRSVHIACLYRNDGSSVIEIAVSLIQCSQVSPYFRQKSLLGTF